MAIFFQMLQKQIYKRESSRLQELECLHWLQGMQVKSYFALV